MTSTKKIAAALLIAALACTLAGCSREQRDWRSAQAADSIEAYDQFLSRHPEGQLATQARSRLVQLTEQRDWDRASSADTADAYMQFLKQHPNGKWSQEARIRRENFALEGQPYARANQSAASAASLPPAPQSAAPPTAAAPRVAPASTSSPPAPPERAVVTTGSPAHTPGLQTTAAAPAPAAASESFGIQLGAFSSEPKATAEWRRVKTQFASELAGLTPNIVSATTAAGHLFRLQARVENEAKARAICASLAQKSQGCVVVLPQH